MKFAVFKTYVRVHSHDALVSKRLFILGYVIMRQSTIPTFDSLGKLAIHPEDPC